MWPSQVLLVFAINIGFSFSGKVNTCSSIAAAISTDNVDQCILLWTRLNEVNVYGEKNDVRNEVCEAAVVRLPWDEIAGIRDPSVESRIHEICSIYPRTKQSECRTLSRSILIRLVTLGQDPKITCQLLYHSRNNIFTTSTQPKTSEVTSKTTMPVANASFISCDICEYVTERIKYFLTKKPIDDAIENFMHNVCDHMGNSRDKCHRIVNVDVAVFIHFISHDVRAHSICSLIRFCEPTKEEKEAPFCPLCEYLINHVRAEIVSNTSVAQIEQVLKRVCSKLPQWNDVCEEIVTTDVPALVNFLARKANARHICQYLVFCPSTVQLSQMVANQVLLRESSLCHVCKPIVHSVQAFLESNATVVEIEFLLDKLCALTVVVEEQCRQVVTEYLPQILSLLANETDPELVCEALHLCGQMQSSTDVVVPDKSDDIPLCPLCIYLLKRLHKEVSNDTSFPNIAHAVVRLCPTTGPFMRDCQAIIKGHERAIAKQMERAEDEGYICQNINVCPTDRGFMMDAYLKPSQVSGKNTAFPQMLRCADLLVNNPLRVIAKPVDQPCTPIQPISSINDILRFEKNSN